MGEMTPERLAEIRRLRSEQIDGTINDDDYECYLENRGRYIDELFEHIDAQAKEVARLKSITLNDIDNERIQRAVTEYEDVWVAYQNAHHKEVARLRGLLNEAMGLVPPNCKTFIERGRKALKESEGK